MNIDILQFIIIFGPAIASIIWAIIAWNIYVNEKNIKAKDGIIKEQKNKKENDIITIYTGIAEHIFDRSFFIEGKEIDPFKMYNNGNFAISIKILKNKIYVSAKVRSLDGKITAEIENNEWELNPNNYFKRNFDKSGLEIIDEFGIPIFQIDLIDNNSIRLGGIFINEITSIIIKSNTSPLTAYGGIPDIENLKKEGLEIQKMFKYPSNKYIGERVKIDKSHKFSFKIDTIFTGYLKNAKNEDITLILINCNINNQEKKTLIIKKVEAELQNICNKNTKLISPDIREIYEIKELYFEDKKIVLNPFENSFQRHNIEIESLDKRNGYFLFVINKKVDSDKIFDKKIVFKCLDSNLIEHKIKQKLELNT